MSAATEAVGTVVSLWRYPVKSMIGEELNASECASAGLLGDRVYAIVDRTSGKVASAKNPKKWPTLFQFRAAFVAPPQPGRELPPVLITLPNGDAITSDQADVNQILSRELGRDVTLEYSAPGAPALEEYWPAVEGLAQTDTVTDEAMPAGTFFDCATVHVLTTATLDHLRSLYPEGRFEVRRFRPNVVVQALGSDFLENGWGDAVVGIGDRVRLNVVGPCPRCVMTTLAQGDLPQDLGILRTAAKHNKAHVGVYAAVAQAGRIRRGDSVTLHPPASAAA